MVTRNWSSFFLISFFKPHAIPLDAAEAVRAHSGKVPGFCYMIGRGPYSYMLSHLTGLSFCLYVKLLLTSIFNSVDFWSSMSRLYLDIEFADVNVDKESGVLIDGKFQGDSLRLPKSTNPQNKRFGSQEICTALLRRVDCWITVSFLTSFLEIQSVRLCKRHRKERGWKFGWSWLPQISKNCWP